MPKRRAEEINVEQVISGINLDRGLRAGLSDLSQDELTALLADIANENGVSTATFKRMRMDLPSFSSLKWSQFARQYGLPTDADRLDLEKFLTPSYDLPPSFQMMMFENGWRWRDVYRETFQQSREQAKVRALEPYIVPIISLFQGRVIDKPEHPMTETEYSTGGEVEHEIFMMGGILFFILEFKLNSPDANSVSRLFLALLSAAKQNSEIDFAGLRVYGLLTDAISFNFYSYDPKTQEFFFDELLVVNPKRPGAMVDMIKVSNKIFGLVLSAYIDGLVATIAKSKNRAKNNNFTSVGSTDTWEVALSFAQKCVAKFSEPATGHENLEKRGKEALELLLQSVHSIPRASPYTPDDDDSLSQPKHLKETARRLVNEQYDKFITA